jgi:hypothetical protein
MQHRLTTGCYQDAISDITIDGVSVYTFNGKVWVPTSLQQHIVAWYHDSLQHAGITPMIETIGQTFTWKGLWGMVKEHVSTCDSCQRNKKIIFRNTQPTSGYNQRIITHRNYYIYPDFYTQPWPFWTPLPHQCTRECHHLSNSAYSFSPMAASTPLDWTIVQPRHRGTDQYSAMDINPSITSPAAHGRSSSRGRSSGGRPAGGLTTIHKASD